MWPHYAQHTTPNHIKRLQESAQGGGSLVTRHSANATTAPPPLAMSNTPSRSPHEIRVQEKKELQFLNSKLETYGERWEASGKAGRLRRNLGRIVLAVAWRAAHFSNLCGRLMSYGPVHRGNARTVAFSITFVAWRSCSWLVMQLFCGYRGFELARRILRSRFGVQAVRGPRLLFAF